MPDTPYEHDAPLDRLLRKVYELDTWSLPITERRRYEAMLGKGRPQIDEWAGETPIFRVPPPEATPSNAPYDEHFLWESSY